MKLKIRRRDMRYRNLCGPLSVQLEITEACNLSCIHCYNYWRDKSNYNTKYLDERKINYIVDALIAAKVFSVTLTGGEPLLFWRILPKVIQKITQAGINVGLNSNLCLLTDEVAIALKESGLNNITVSFLCSKKEVHDFITNTHDSWGKTISGIKKAREYGFRISSNTVLTKLNLPYLRETAKLMKELGISTFCATKASPALNSRNFEDIILSKEELRQSLNELIQIKDELNIKVDILECYPLCLIGDIKKYSFFARRRCTAGITTCTISPSGDVRPCSHADMNYGNLFETSFKNIWDAMSEWRDCRYIPLECQKCKFLKQCGGGCRMEAKYYGDIRGKDPFMCCPTDIKVQNSINKKGEVILPERLRINPQLRIRKESFGATIAVPFGKPLLINNDALRILEELLNKEVFAPNFVSDEFKLDIEKTSVFLYHLFQNNIIQQEGG